MKRRSNIKDLTGQQFGELTVIGLAPQEGKKCTRWYCQCSCGAQITVDGSNLKRETNHARSCKKCANERQKAPYDILSPEYTTWCDMKRRCYNEASKRFKHYGGKGVQVCDRWLSSFPNFLEDMGPRPSNRHSIDRVDVNGNYEPGNCRWATRTEQMRNTTRNVFVTHDRETKTLSAWAEETEIHPATLWSRYKAGDRGDWLFRPLHQKKPHGALNDPQMHL